MKSPWLNVLDHRFPDMHLTNCRRLGGSFAFSSPPPQVLRDRSAGDVLRYYVHFDGRMAWLRYTPQAPLRDVVGTELRIRARLGHSPAAGSPFRPYNDTLCWGGNWALGVRTTRTDSRPDSMNELTVTMNGHQRAWSRFPDIAEAWFEIGWSWRVSGQAILTFNGNVAAAWPDLETGNPYELSQIGVGSGVIGPSGSQRIKLLGDVVLLRLSVLTRERSENFLNSAFPIRGVDTGQIAACRDLIAPALRALISLFRHVISTGIGQGGARTTTSARLHTAAVAAANSLARYADGDDRALPDFRKRLITFLRLLQDLTSERLPDIERQIRRILDGVDVTGPCRNAAERVIAAQQDDFQRLRLLLNTVSEAVQETLGIEWT
ncbi:MAG: hypothetical protein ACKV22_16045 [Bryobacteraceae bacterium]